MLSHNHGQTLTNVAPKYETNIIIADTMVPPCFDFE